MHKLGTLTFPRLESANAKYPPVSHGCMESWSVQSCYQSTYERQKKSKREKGTVCAESCNCFIGPCLWQVSFLHSVPSVVTGNIPVISKLAVGFVQIKDMRIWFPSETSCLSFFVEISITAESFSVCKTHTSWAIFSFIIRNCPAKRLHFKHIHSEGAEHDILHVIHIKPELYNRNNYVYIFKYVIMLFKSNSSSYLIKLMAY